MRTPILLIALAISDFSVAIRNKYDPGYEPSVSSMLFWLFFIVLFIILDIIELKYRFFAG